MRGDLVTFGKVMGGGLPCAAFGGRAEIMSRLAPVGPVYQAGTLSGNPLATAAGLATLSACTPEVYAAVDLFAGALSKLVSAELAAVGVPHYLSTAGSLFTVFLGRTDPVTNFADAKDQSTAALLRVLPRHAGRRRLPAAVRRSRPGSPPPRTARKSCPGSPTRCPPPRAPPPRSSAVRRAARRSPKHLVHRTAARVRIGVRAGGNGPPDGRDVRPMAMRNVISTLNYDGTEVMGPGVLMYHYPANDIMNGSLLTVESNHFAFSSRAARSSMCTRPGSTRCRRRSGR